MPIAIRNTLLLVLSGAATRLARWLVGLDKRYVADVDLGVRTSTGDVEGDVVEEALQAWPGALLLVTHDAPLAAAVCTETWRLEHGALRTV